LNNANMQNCIWKSFMYFYIFVPSSSSWKKKKTQRSEAEQRCHALGGGFSFLFWRFWLSLVYLVSTFFSIFHSHKSVVQIRTYYFVWIVC
jgi:hypothetical protein